MMMMTIMMMMILMMMKTMIMMIMMPLCFPPVPPWHLQLGTSFILRTLTTSIADTVCSS